MRIALGSDHRGYAAKERLRDVLKKGGHEVTDFGVGSDAGAADYPDYAIPVAEAVSGGQVECGILICGTGFGMCIAANKVHGVRAVTAQSELDARLSRQHNNANVLCLSGDFLGQESIDKVVDAWLQTEFEGGRHLRRVEKITKYEHDHEAK